MELRELAIAVGAGLNGRKAIEQAFPDVATTLEVDNPDFKWWESGEDDES